MMRDKNIQFFDEPGRKVLSDLRFEMDDLMNLECLYASHNLIKDVYGISKLTWLLELNLSFNQIIDITPLEQLTMLEKLHLNRNKISIIEPVRKLTSLQVLGLFHNEIFNQASSFEVLTFLVSKYRLRDISIDGNPITSTVRFRNQLIVALPKLQVLDDEKLRDLDREVAAKYFEIHNLPLPVLPSVEPKENTMVEENGEDAAAETMEKKVKTTKRVKFGTPGKDIDDDHEGDW